MACCNGIARCFSGLQEYSKVRTVLVPGVHCVSCLLTRLTDLEWLEEAATVDKNMIWTNNPAQFGEPYVLFLVMRAH